LRYILNIAGLKSIGLETQKIDEEEYNTGRIIGLLERIFIFLFVFGNLKIGKMAIKNREHPDEEFR
jgi:hypothetical protein